MKVLLTGSTGYLGAEILAALLHREVSVLAWGRNADRLAALKQRFGHCTARLTIKGGDLMDERAIPSGTETVVHAAALRPPMGEDEEERFCRANADATRHIVRLAERAGCRRFVYISTQAVYGTHGAPWTEEAPTRPETDYARTKLAGEWEACQANELQVVILRLSRLYGITPFVRWDELPGRFARLVWEGEPLRIQGTGNQRFDLLHVRDAANFIAQLCLATEWPVARIFNLGGGSSVSINELAQLLRSLARERDLPEVRIQNEDATKSIQLRHLELSMARTFSTFPWRPAIPLRKGLDEYLSSLVATCRVQNNDAVG